MKTVPLENHHAVPHFLKLRFLRSQHRIVILRPELLNSVFLRKRLGKDRWKEILKPYWLLTSVGLGMIYPESDMDSSVWQIRESWLKSKELRELIKKISIDKVKQECCRQNKEKGNPWCRNFHTSFRHPQTLTYPPESRPLSLPLMDHSKSLPKGLPSHLFSMVSSVCSLQKERRTRPLSDSLTPLGGVSGC